MINICRGSVISVAAISILFHAQAVIAFDGKPLVVVVQQKNKKIHNELIESLIKARKDEQQYQLQIITARVFRDKILDTKHNFRPDLIISVGADITGYIVGLNLPSPLLSVLTPRLSYKQFREKHKESIEAGVQGQFSAIYLDQSLARHFNLIETILPNASHVGAVFGPETINCEAAVRAEATTRDLQLSVGKVTSENDLISTLDKVLNKSDVMLSIYDPVVFSRTSGKNVLLTTYRWRVPLIGMSPAYVRAGALTTVHSTPSQIGIQLEQTINEFFRNDPHKLPNAQHPSIFSVMVNYKVAKAMGIQIEEEIALRQKIEALESSLALQ